MDNVMKMELLLADRHTYLEAKRRLKDDNFIIFDTIEDFKEALYGERECEIDIAELRKGYISDISVVRYGGNEYIIAYIN